MSQRQRGEWGGGGGGGGGGVQLRLPELRALPGPRVVQTWAWGGPQGRINHTWISEGVHK